MTDSNIKVPEVESAGKPDDGKKNRPHFRLGKRRKSWRDMTAAQEAGNIIFSIVEVILTGWALWDIKQRPQSEIKGNKRTWVMAAFIQPFGPVLYFVFGRKKAGAGLAA